ncbi:sensor domain-containing protein [Haloglomus salinum]|uniref:sensor domain-containing protein n=1 Tax=Haloglomus salinum TaxID=2962673 RepID=UPI0020C9DE09|nr:sensor domain-containing protein [Haloglomus salinum]
MASNPASSQSSGAAESTLSMALRRSLGAPLRVQTYKNLLYLALAFPLGLVYFVGLVVGVALGVGLLITWIGLPILLVTLFAATAVAGFEAALARYFGGVNATVPTFLTEFDISSGLVFPGNGFVDAVKRLVTTRTTWTSVILVLAKFGFGLVSFVALTVSGAVTGAFLTAPFIYDDPDVLLGIGGVVVDGDYTVGPWVIDTFPEALVASVVGVVFLFVALSLLNSLARFHARYTAKLLRGDDEEM